MIEEEDCLLCLMNANADAAAGLLLADGVDVKPCADDTSSSSGRIDAEILIMWMVSFL